MSERLCRIRAYFGRRHKIESAEVLERIAREGVDAKFGREKLGV